MNQLSKEQVFSAFEELKQALPVAPLFEEEWEYEVVPIDALYRVVFWNRTKRGTPITVDAIETSTGVQVEIVGTEQQVIDKIKYILDFNAKIARVPFIGVN